MNLPPDRELDPGDLLLLIEREPPLQQGKVPGEVVPEVPLEANSREPSPASSVSSSSGTLSACCRPGARSLR
jgi:hypothetical protein